MSKLLMPSLLLRPHQRPPLQSRVTSSPGQNRLSGRASLTGSPAISLAMAA
jgi:hypothetical protein